jgi:hypothetical protein
MPLRGKGKITPMISHERIAGVDQLKAKMKAMEEELTKLREYKRNKEVEESLGGRLVPDWQWCKWCDKPWLEWSGSEYRCIRCGNEQGIEQ